VKGVKIKMENKIKYSFNTGDKIKVIQGGLFADILKGVTGVITDEMNNNGIMGITNGFNLEIIKPESFKGQIWRLSCYGEFELIETTNFEGCERLQYRDTKRYKTIIKDGFIEFQKNDYIEENEWFKNNDVTVESAREIFVCIKDCIYKLGSKVEIMRKVKDFIIVTDGKNINPFRQTEFEEYFTDCIDVNKVNFKLVDTRQIKVMKEI
jgi:hypothetical protein